MLNATFQGWPWKVVVCQCTWKKIHYAKFSLKFMQNTTIWENKEYFITTRGTILASKYRIVDLKSHCIPYSPPKNLDWPWPLNFLRRYRHFNFLSWGSVDIVVIVPASWYFFYLCIPATASGLIKVSVIEKQYCVSVFHAKQLTSDILWKKTDNKAEKITRSCKWTWNRRKRDF